MTTLMKTLAASASALAIGAFAVNASAQDYDDAETTDIEIEQSTDAAVDLDMDDDMKVEKKDWDKSEKKDISWDAKKAKWDAAARLALEECVGFSEACNVATTNAAGVLVFPELTSASFVVGGTGGTGVLMVEGEPVGYYNLAAGSLGFQAGIEQVSQVMTFNSEDALADLTGDAEWRAGADANITVIEDGATATAIADGDLDSLGEISTITFNQQGLAAGVAVEGIRLAAVETDDESYKTEKEEWDEEMDEQGETSY